MRKRDEIVVADSCLNRALPQERLFVMLARDAASPAAIRAWAKARIRLGLNQPEDAQILDALIEASGMESERADIRRLVDSLAPRRLRSLVRSSAATAR